MNNSLDKSKYEAFEILSEYIDKLKIAFILTTMVGLMFGILKSVAFVLSNSYLQLEMYYLAIHSTSSMINNCLLISLGALIALIIVRTFLNFISVNRRASDIIVCGILPSLLIFIFGGYWINKLYLPGFFETKSIIGNAVWLFTCVLSGWLIFKILQARSSFVESMFNAKVLAAVFSLVIALNVVNYFYFQPLEPGRPNLILISVDTLRADRLSCYGYSRNTTPNIDRFAKDGVMFANAIAQAPWTLPSHMSLLTGLYSSSHGVTAPVNKLGDEHLTLAEILQNAGYKTMSFTDGGYVSSRFGYQGFDAFDDIGDKSSITAIETTYQKAVGWLRKSHSKPFFLFLHTYQVHCPYDPISDYDIFSDRNYQGIIEASKDCARDFKNKKSRMTLKDYLYIGDKYDGEIYYTDHVLGELFRELKNLGIYDTSVIVLTSDHGEDLSDHGNISHDELYDEVVKVPLVISAPAFPKNRSIDVQVESIDVMPTILELTGISTPTTIDGKSLVELVEKGSFDKTFAFSENSYLTENGNHYKAIRNNSWKLFHRSQDKLELYDLKNDPKERYSLLKEKVEVAESMHKQLQTWMDTQKEKTGSLSADKIELGRELTEKLKALGYIN